MKRSFGNFTRGSQLIETFGLMFAAGLKPMLWVVVTLLSVALGWLIWRETLTLGAWLAIALIVASGVFATWFSRANPAGQD